MSDDYYIKGCNCDNCKLVSSFDGLPIPTGQTVPNKQEKKMNYSNSNYAVAMVAAQPEQKQEKLYMVERLTDIKNDKSEELRSHFHVDDDFPPETAEEFLERVKAGKFILREKTLWNDTFWGRVQW